MKHELLPCPFCGGAVSECDESPLYGGSIMHDETECLFKNNLLFHGNIAERWNSRPLEDALRSRIAELEKSAIVWHKFDINNINTYPETANMYLTISIPERAEYMEIDDESVYNVLWWELYSEEYWNKHNVTHWAYLPEPPKEEK
jgi:hypothetical protein